MVKSVGKKRASSKATPLDFGFGSPSTAPKVRAVPDENTVDLDAAVADQSDPWVQAHLLSRYFAKLATSLRSEVAGRPDDLRILAGVWKTVHRPSSPVTRRIELLLFIEWLTERSQAWNAQLLGRLHPDGTDPTPWPPELDGKDAKDLRALVVAWQHADGGAKASGSRLKSKWEFFADYHHKTTGERVTGKRLKDDWSAYRSGRVR